MKKNIAKGLCAGLCASCLLAHELHACHALDPALYHTHPSAIELAASIASTSNIVSVASSEASWTG